MTSRGQTLHRSPAPPLSHRLAKVDRKGRAHHPSHHSDGMCVPASAPRRNPRKVSLPPSDPRNHDQMLEPLEKLDAPNKTPRTRPSNSAWFHLQSPHPP